MKNVTFFSSAEKIEDTAEKMIKDDKKAKKEYYVKSEKAEHAHKGK